MSTEKRSKTTNQYLYSGHRQGTKVEKSYIGPMSDANVAFTADYLELADARRAFERKQRKAEMTLASEGEKHLIRLSSLSGCYSALRGLEARSTQPIPSPPTITNNEGFDSIMEADALDGLPLDIQFKRLCDQVDRGEPGATDRLRRLLEATPDQFRGIIDLIALATSQTVEALAGDSLSQRELIGHQLRQDAAKLLPAAGVSMADRMQAEILFLLRLDAFRCHVASSRESEFQSEKKFWTSMSMRANKRYRKAAICWTKQRQQSRKPGG